MSAVLCQTRCNPFACFEVVYESSAELEWIVLRSTRDADPATLAFHDEWDRLKHDHVVGNLLLVYHDEVARTLLSMPLGQEITGLGARDQARPDC